MDPIKLAFSKIKEEISSLREEMVFLKRELNLLSDTLNSLNKPLFPDKPTDKPTDTNQKSPLEGLKTINNGFSMRNEGVPTDKQTNQQTNQQTQGTLLTKGFFEFKQANEVFNSLDGLKRETASVFKQLTDQEMLVFTTLYQFENQGLIKITYRTLAQSLKLSESSIREYITKLIKKGIPIEKTKENNKTVFLNISKDLKNLISLDTILALKGL